MKTRPIPAPLALALALAVVGCEDAAGPDRTPFGTYTLHQVNDQALPVVVDQSQTSTLEVTRGWLLLNRDGTWRELLALRIDDGAQAFTTQFADDGRYTLNGADLELTSGAGFTYAGTMRPGEVRYSFEGVSGTVSLVYRK